MTLGGPSEVLHEGTIRETVFRTAAAPDDPLTFVSLSCCHGNSRLPSLSSDDAVGLMAVPTFRELKLQVT